MVTEFVREEARRVATAADENIDALLADLEAWVNLDTPALDIEQVDLLAEQLAQRLDEYGLEPELVAVPERGQYVHARLQGSGEGRIALLCHHDTVFPIGTASRRRFRQDGDRAYGPGIADMKGGIAIAAHAARYLAAGPRPFGCVEIVSASDEESRPQILRTIDRLEGFDAVLCMECGREDGSIVSARKGARWFRIHASGRSAHAGVDPDSGHNAVEALCREAVRLAELHHVREGLTFQVTGLVGKNGTSGINTVPAEAFLTGDIRAATSDDLDWAMSRVEAWGSHNGVSFRSQDLGGPPPLVRTPAVGTLARTAIALGAELGHEFGETSTGGISDGSWTASCGIPTLDGLGPVGGRDHTPAEYVELASFAPRCGVVAGLVAAVGGGLLAANGAQEHSLSAAQE